MRVAILAPTDFSLYARLLARWAVDEPGLELAAVVVRRTFNPQRMRAELRRDGPRLLRKLWRKAFLGGGDEKTTDLLQLAAERGAGKGGLAAFCRERGVPHATVGDLNDPAALELLQREAPQAIAFTGGGLLRAALLGVAPHGVLNAHMGLLPRYRGMDVIEWAALERRPNLIGITLHRMDAGVDTGPILRIHPIAPRAGESFAQLRSRFEVAMVTEMEAALRALRDGTARETPQAAAEGRQYFVMHQRLRSIAQARLGRAQ